MQKGRNYEIHVQLVSYWMQNQKRRRDGHHRLDMFRDEKGADMIRSFQSNLLFQSMITADKQRYIQTVFDDGIITKEEYKELITALREKEI